MKILIYRVGSLGDTLLALPCFLAIRKKFPKAYICLLTHMAVGKKAVPMMDVLSQTGTVDEVLEYTLKSQVLSTLFSLILNLRRKKFDLAVHLAAARGWRISIRDLIFLKLTGTKRVLGVPFTPKNPVEIKEGIWEWEAERLAKRLRPWVSVNLSDPALWDLAFTVEEKEEAVRLLARKERPKQRWIAASVGTKADSKDWTENNWLALMKSLTLDGSEIGLVMIGCEADFERSQRCLAEWKGPRLNLCGLVSARVSAALLKETELFIGHDSGPMHLAGVVGTPCVAIFAARNFPGQWFPQGGERNRIFYHRTECFGCELEVCIQHAKKCILSISVQEVQSEIRKMLNRVL